MINSLKSQREKYCEVTEYPYSYCRYTELYPNIPIRINSNFRNLNKEEKREYNRIKLREYKARQKLIKENKLKQREGIEMNYRINKISLGK